MPWRATFFLEQGKQGWTESWYKDGDKPANAMAQAEALSILRVRILQRGALLNKIRISVPGAPRDAEFKAYSDASSTGQYGAAVNSEDREAQVSINVRLFAGDATWRTWMVRGVPADAIDNIAGKSTVQPIYEAILRNFVTQVAAGSWALRKSGYGASNRVLSIVQLSGKLQTVTTVDNLAAGIVAGAVVNLRGGTGVSNINGNWRVRAVLGLTSFSVWPKITRQYGDLDAGSLDVRLVTQTYPSITAGTPIGVTTRRTGRPSYLPRGRRSVRRS